MSMNINGLGNTYNDINTNSRQYKALKTLSLSQVSFPLDFPLCYIFPYGFTNSDKGKNKGKKNI
jgi:hypothetical protein